MHQKCKGTGVFMDRKSKQKIKWLCLFLTALVLVVGIGFGRQMHTKAVWEAEKEEIAVIYPEKEARLWEAIDFYNRRFYRQDLWFLASMLIVAAGFGVILCFGFHRQEQTRQKQMEARLEYIYEQLCALQQKKGAIVPYPSETDSRPFFDVCEKLKEVSRAISVMQDRLKEEENNTKALITDISHQLKTPLASIRMSYELSGERGLSEAERTSFRASEEKEILNMERLLDELVKLSRLENSMITIRPEVTGLKTTICEAVSLLYGKAAAKNIEICVDCETDIRLPHDPQWTAEALANIIDNAIKYSKPDTDVSIRVIPLATTVLIEIEDEGIGIPEHEVHAIFQRFYRGSNARETQKEGAGVGLYLARTILEQQGGSIVAKRKTGHGTIFKVTLPIEVSRK